VVQAALQALGAIASEDRSALPPLLRRLEHGKPRHWSRWLNASAWLNPERDRALARRFVPRLAERVRAATPAEWPGLFDCFTALGTSAAGAAPALEALYRSGRRGIEAREVLVAWARASRDPAPALRGGLRDQDFHVQMMACRMAHELGPEAVAVLPDLAEALRQEDSELMLAHISRALLSVGVGSDRLAEELARLLEVPHCRVMAARALADLGPAAARVLPTLKAQLREREPSPTLAVAVLALSSEDREAWAVLEAALGSGKADEQCWALKELKALGPPGRRLAPAVRRLLRAESVVVRLEAAWALASVEPGDSEAAAALASLVHGPLREPALIAATDLGPRAAGAAADVAAVLQESVERSDERQVLQALTRMGRGAAPALGLLRQRARRADRFDSGTLACLAALGPEAADAVPDLLPLLEDPSAERRAQAARVLGHIGLAARGALARLRRQHEEDDTEPRAWAAFALARIEGDARPYLAELVREVRHCGAAAEALTALGAEARPALPALLALLRDGDAAVRRPAVVALRGLGAHAVSAAPGVRRLLADRRPGVRADAAEVLAELHRSGARP
jgi:HEAT repeat protein